MGDTGVLRRLPLMAGVVAASFAAFAFDSTFYPSGAWCDHTWKSASSWYYDTYAKEGGVATFTSTGFPGAATGTQKNDLTQNVEGLQLRGIYFNKLVTTFLGKDLTFVSPYPFISSTQTSTGSNVALNMKGTGDNTLAKIGSGRVVVDAPISGFAAVEAFDGTLVNTNALDGSAAFVDDETTPLVVRTGTVLYSPAKAEGGVASATVADLRSAKGRGVVKIAKGSNSSATLTATAFTPQDGGILEVQASDLGGTEKLVVTDKAASGPDGRVIAANGNKINFLAYDADSGYVSGVDADADDLSGLPANVKVYGKSTDAANTEQTVNDALDFTDAEGFIWRPAATAGSTTLNFRGTLTAPQGVTFASKRSSGNRPTINVSGAYNEYAPGWTFPVRLSGVYLKQLRSDTFGPGAELWVEGSVGDTDSSAYFDIAYQNNNGSDEYKKYGNIAHPHVYDLHVSGNGSGSGAIRHVNSNWEQSVWRHTGRVFLEDDTVVTGGGNGLLEFCGPIAGRGGLKISEGYMNLRGTNSFAGTLELADSTKLNVRNSGTLGAGDVKLGSNAYLYFTDHVAMTVTNRIDGVNGRGAIQNSNIAFDGDTSFKQVFVQQNGNLQIGATLSAKTAQLDGNATISATAHDGTFVLGADDATTNRIAATMTDGALGGRLSFTKQGKNTVEVYGRNTYSGKTVVKGGTLRFASDMWTIPDLAYWCDASDRTTMTIDENGKVKEWRSKVGDFKFIDAGQTISGVRTSFPSISENTYNNHSALRFVGVQGGTKVFERLKGSKSCTQRTIFIVAYSMSSLASNAGNGLFGEAGQDRITRTSTSGNTSVRATDSGSVATSAGYGYENGVKKTSLETNCALGGPNVIDLLRPRDVLGGYYSMYSTFVPGIAGCNSDGRNWGGDFCEIIAFSRTLTDAERCTVENYLMKKWNPTNLASKFHTDEECAIPKAENPLPTTTVLEIQSGAMLDLNGINQTVKTLQGEGTIFNSSTNAAILTVTEGGDFHGTVKGNITLVRTGSAEEGRADALSLLIREGGTFIAGGDVTTTLSPYNPSPVTNGLSVWLDAKAADTVLRDDDGNVTNWLSRAAGNIHSFVLESGYTKGTYETDGFNTGKPSVLLPGGHSRLMAAAANGTASLTTIRTVFLVAKHSYVSGHGDYRYAFGPAGDRGLRHQISSDGKTYTFQMYGPYSWAHFGDTFRVNGVDYTDSRVEELSINTGDGRYCAAARINDDHFDKYPGNVKNCNWYLGSYNEGYVCCAMDVAELICYERALSDYELLLVENYLMEKWIRSGTSWPAEATSAFDSSCGLGVTGGARLDFGGADLVLKYLSGNEGQFVNIGSLTLTDSLMLYVLDGSINEINVAGNLTIGENCRVQVNGIEDLSRSGGPYRCLSVSGNVSGDFAGVDGLTRKWSWSRAGKTWLIAHCGMMIFIR